MVRLLAGAVLNLKTINISDDPVSVASNTMFIPRLATMKDNMAIFAALVGATNATGTAAFTDIVAVDMNNNAALLMTFSNSALAYGAYEAMRMLMHTAAMSMAGAQNAYAIVKGVHSVATVVAHSDEGGFLRDVIRKCRVRPSHGAIFVADYRDYIGMPSVDPARHFTL